MRRGVPHVIINEHIVDLWCQVCALLTDKYSLRHPADEAILEYQAVDQARARVHGHDHRLAAVRTEVPGWQHMAVVALDQGGGRRRIGYRGQVAKRAADRDR